MQSTPDQSLVERHKPYALRLAAIFCDKFGGADPDSVESDALFGLFDASLRFDPGRGKQFVAYARKRIIGQIFDGLRRDGEARLTVEEMADLNSERPERSRFLPPDEEAAIRDEAEFVRSNLGEQRSKQNGNRRLTATSLAESMDITVSAAARRVRKATRIIYQEPSLS